MTKRSPTREVLLDRVKTLEGQLVSQEDIQALIQELQIHQEEVRVQNAALFETQRELEASRDRYTELYDFAPIAFASLDVGGLILSLNLAGAKLLACERQSALGMPLHLYVKEHDRRRLLDYLARCRRDARTPAPVDLDLRGEGEEAIPVEIHCKRFQADAARAPVFFTALIDLRERRRAEAERLRAAFERDRLANEEAAARLASEAKDRFLAVLSHELRTPLTPILLTLERLEADVTAPSPTIRAALDTIRRNLAVETRLIDDLLDITRIERDRLNLVDEVVDLHEALRHAVEMCGEEIASARLGLEVELGANHPHVRGDGTRLRQVFWNLLINALRYTAPGGAVRVRTYDRDDRVCTEVVDTGRGVAPEDLERVFEPFEQATAGTVSSGLGLGLAICRGVVRAHGGTIRASSPGRGRGTTFTVELPTCDPPARQERPSARHRSGEGGRRILLVEDNDDTAVAMATLLRMHGYEVEIAHSVDEARRAGPDRFDVLLSDLQLPDGSGLDLARELSGPNSPPAIAMSGFGTAGDVERSRGAGFAKHLVKPVAFDRVLEAVEEVAGVRTAGSPSG